MPLPVSPRPLVLPLHDHLTVVRRDFPALRRVELDLCCDDAVILTVESFSPESEDMESLYADALQLLAASLLSLAFETLWVGHNTVERSGALAVFLRDEVMLQFIDTVRECATGTEGPMDAVNGTDWT